MKIIWLGAIGLMFTTMMVDAANAQVRPDRTLGSESSRVRVDRIPGRDGVTRDSDVIEGGARRGHNLFHSFRQFDVPAERGAYFSDPNGVSRIFSRVTGHDRSEINGTLGVLGDADLYFINPNGILFGPHASLDLGGSFTATTASAIRFGEESFSATNPETPSGLLRVDPSAFFFNQLSSGNIVSRAAGDSGLQVENGETLTLLGGDVAIRGGALNAWGGRVEVGAVADKGTVELTEEGRLLFPDELSRSDVLFNNAFVDVSLDESGDVDVVGNLIGIENHSLINAGIAADLGTTNSRAGDIQLDGNLIRVVQRSLVKNDVNRNYSGNAGDVRIHSNSLVVRGGSQLTTSTLGHGNAGNVVIDAGQVSFDDSDAFSTVTEGGRGRAGNIVLTADSLFLSNGSQLTTSTLGHGNAGNVVIDAGQVSFDDSDAFSTVTEGGRGRAGNIVLTADSLFLSNGSQLTASTFGRGRAGIVIINAQNQVQLQGNGTGITSSSGGSTREGVIRASGQGGDVRINTSDLFLSDGAKLIASTFGRSRAGNVIINARNQVQLQGNGTDILSGAGGLFNRELIRASGRGGDIQINTDSLFLSDGAKLDASITGSGSAGSVIINAQDQVQLDSEAFILNSSGATFNGELIRASGRGGDIQISTDNLFLSGRAELIASTLGRSRAGNVIINAQDQMQMQGRRTIILSGAGGLFNRRLIRASGRGGDIRINTNDLFLSDGTQLDASTNGIGRAGSVIIDARGQVYGSGTNIFSSAGGFFDGEDFKAEVIRASGRGGDIRINTSDLFLSNGTQLNASTVGRGRAGSVIINAQNQVQVQGSGTAIFSRSGGISPNEEVIQAGGRGGDVHIRTDDLFLSDGAKLDASTNGRGRAGNVIIDAQDQVQLQGSGTDIFSRAGGIFNGEVIRASGQGGDVRISTGSLFLSDGAQLDASTFGSGKAGNVVIEADNHVQLDRSYIFATAESTATRPSGDIEITANGLRLFNNSAIRTDDRRPGNVEGGGGNIHVDANYVLATNGSDVLAFSRGGTGGDITLPSFFSEGDVRVGQNRLNRNQQNQLDQNDRIDIDASGDVSPGIIGLVTPDTSAIQNSLADLSDTTIDPDTLLANSCITRTREGGTFLITGTGGLLTDRPDAIPLSTYPTDTVRTEPDDATWQPGDPIIEPQGVYQLPNGELFLSQDCSAQAP